MNLSPLWIRFLTGHGLEAVHWADIGHPTAPDAEIVNYAADHGFVVFTHDLDFGAILAARKSNSPSVVQVRAQDILPESIGEIVVRALHATRPYLETGALVTIDPAHHRIRMLPI
jgi:predicted nuclease of predicted toxin-antitoxin system